MKLNYLKSNDDIITPLRLLKQLPSIAIKAPRMVKGLRIARNTDPGRVAGLGWAVEEAARHNPRGRAVLYQDVSLSYAEFNAWTNRIAHHFHAAGLRKGDVVCVFIENRPELLATAAGLAKLGVVSALVNTSQTAHVLVHSLERRQQLVADDGGLGLHQVDAVRQHLAGLRGVDHGGDHAELAERDHGGEQLGAVLDVDGDHVALLQALGLEVVGHAVGPLVELRVGEADVLVQHRGSMRVFPRGLLDRPAEADVLGRIGIGGEQQPLDHLRETGGDFRELAGEGYGGDDVLLAHAGVSSGAECMTAGR